MAASKTASQAAARSIAEVIQAEEAARKVFETTTFHGPYTIAQLRQAFELIQSKAGWKRPVAYYGLPCGQEDLYREAVAFFQGCRAEVGPDCEPGTFFITSSGYCC